MFGAIDVLSCRLPCMPSQHMPRPVAKAGSVKRIARVLGAGRPIADDDFDALLSETPRGRSPRFWSSVRACQAASRLLQEAGAHRVLDVGSGVGKFCVIAALSLHRRVWGLERRSDLVAESRQLAKSLDADVQIIEGTLESVDSLAFDGFYFFNPFGEYLAVDADRYDQRAPRSLEQHVSDAYTVERWLRAAPVGACLVTYNGLGGRIPTSYQVRKSSLIHDGVLRLWVKDAPEVDDDVLLEFEDGVFTAPPARGSRTTDSLTDARLVEALSQPPPRYSSG